MEKKLIIENFSVPVRPSRKLKEGVNDGLLWEAPVWRLGEKNLNGHVYTRSLAERVVRENIKTMVFDGHDADFVSGHDFACAIAVAENPRIEGDEMVVDIRFLNTELARPYVEQIKAVYEAGILPGVSSVGFGSEDADGVIGEDYEVIRYIDFVSMPAGMVYAGPKNESTEDVEVKEESSSVVNAEEETKEEAPITEAEEVSEPSASEMSEGEEQKSESENKESGMELTEKELAEQREIEEARNVKENFNMNEVVKTPKYSQESVDWVKKLQEAIAIGSTYSSLVPSEIAKKVEMKMETYGVLRKYCTVHKLSGTYAFAVEDSGATATWTSESGSVTETTPSSTPITLTAQALTAIVKVSKELAADVDLMMDYVIESLAKGFAKAEDKAIIKGAGYVASTSYEPVGILTKLKAQSNTPQVVTGTGTSTSVIGFTWGELKQVISKIGAHRKGAVIIMNQTTADHIYEMKNNNTYIFDQTKPLDNIWGMPVIISDLMDDAYKQASSGADAYPVIVANLSFYHIGDRQELNIQTLTELYAATRQIGILADKRMDGNFGNYDAFACMKIAKAS